MTDSQLAPDAFIRLFNDLFLDEYNTRLELGGDEPLYSPGNPNKIIFARGFLQSALHEVAHWCIAGSHRRTLEDFGYWYAPDGRDEETQRKFEEHEVKPQAMEWIFTAAIEQPFFVSLDNLEAPPEDSLDFKTRVRDQALKYLQQGLPTRAKYLVESLIAQYSCPTKFEEYWQKVARDQILPN